MSNITYYKAPLISWEHFLSLNDIGLRLNASSLIESQNSRFQKEMMDITFANSLQLRRVSN